MLQECIGDDRDGFEADRRATTYASPALPVPEVLAVGVQGGLQSVNIVSWTSRFIIVHELLHALGFWHEHQRIDRDSPPGTPFFIEVNVPCIDPPSLFNFDVIPTALLTGTYDFEVKDDRWKAKK